MKNKPLHFFIITSEAATLSWLSATLSVTDIVISGIEAVTIDQLTGLQFNHKQQAVILLDEKIYVKQSAKIHQNLNQLYVDVPILLLTDSLANKDLPTLNKMFNVIDTIARPTLSINSLEHTINSLVKDFKLTQELKKLAHYDALTGAANRYLFQDRLAQIFNRAKRYQENFALLSFDLNEFKKVNDSFGHEVGDLLLKKFVEQLNKITREADTLARLGGDEFFMIMPNMTVNNLGIVLDKIKALFNPKFNLAGQQIKIKTSIGAVVINHQTIEQFTITQALKLADLAVYEAKAQKETAAVIKVT